MSTIDYELYSFVIYEPIYCICIAVPIVYPIQFEHSLIYSQLLYIAVGSAAAIKLFVQKVTFNVTTLANVLNVAKSIQKQEWIKSS